MPTLYAICWQDAYEPWGWAPIPTDYDSLAGGERDAQTFHWSRDEAEAELARVIESTTKKRIEDEREFCRRTGTSPTRVDPERIAEETKGDYSIQTYEVPEPPR